MWKDCYDNCDRVGKIMMVLDDLNAQTIHWHRIHQIMCRDWRTLFFEVNFSPGEKFTLFNFQGWEIIRVNFSLGEKLDKLIRHRLEVMHLCIGSVGTKSRLRDPNIVNAFSIKLEHQSHISRLWLLLLLIFATSTTSTKRLMCQWIAVHNDYKKRSLAWYRNHSLDHAVLPMTVFMKCSENIPGKYDCVTPLQ